MVYPSRALQRPLGGTGGVFPILQKKKTIFPEKEIEKEAKGKKGPARGVVKMTLKHSSKQEGLTQ